MHDPAGLDAFVEEMRTAIRPPVEFHEIKEHINGEDFAAKVLEIFDRWVASGVVPIGKFPEGQA